LQQKSPYLACDAPTPDDAAMTIVRPAVFRATVAAAVLFQTTSTAFAAEVNRVEARFEIFGFGGLHVLTNRTTVEELKRSIFDRDGS
jgi:hypothetical protein